MAAVRHNQMLAGIALMLCAVVLFKMKRQRYAWVALPTSWLLICTLTAGWQESFSPDTKVVSGDRHNLVR